jgi:hypothetical protein
MPNSEAKPSRIGGFELLATLGKGGWVHAPNPTGGSTTFSGYQFGGPTDV